MTDLTPELKKELFPYGNLMLCGYRGSVSQNTYIPNTDPNSIDDIDVMGIYLAPKKYYFSYQFPRKFSTGMDKFVGEWDTVNYEFKHYISLLMQQNPNVLALLWLKEEHYIPVDNVLYDSWGKSLITNRDLFRSKSAYNSFVGYASGQLKRMTHHAHQGYMGEKRKALVSKFGYDTKNASHLIRLLTMGIEFLETGILQVYREHDAELLRDIKRGKWTLKQVQDEAEALFKYAKNAYDNSVLPEKIDKVKVDALIKNILKHYLCGEINEDNNS